jgi:hypothetical protein
VASQSLNAEIAGTKLHGTLLPNKPILRDRIGQFFLFVDFLFSEGVYPLFYELRARGVFSLFFVGGVC